MATNNMYSSSMSPVGSFRSTQHSMQYSPMMSSGLRPQRPRYGFHAPSPYPRPRSSASKPNPSSVPPIAEETGTDSYFSPKKSYSSGYPYDDTVKQYERDSNFSHSYRSENSDSSYLTCPDSSFSSEKNSYMENQSTPSYSNFKEFKSNQRFFGKYTSSPVNTGYQSQNYGMQQQQQQQQQPQQFSSPKFKRFGMKRKATPQQTVRCELCNLDFTSQIPLDMHLRGAKHAKKMKAQETLKLLQEQGQAKPTDTATKIFSCDICGVMLNGALQLQTHFEGSKHKNKSQAQANKASETTAEKPVENGGGSKTTMASGAAEEIKVVSDASTDEPKPAKLAKYCCELCGVIVNSEIQLQQHLDSKRHQAKVEGKPFVRARKFKKKKDVEDGEKEETANGDEGQITTTTTAATATATPSVQATVYGIAPLESSFVKKETLN